LAAIVYPFHADFGAGFLKSISAPQELLDTVNFHPWPEKSDSKYVRAVALADLVLSGVGFTLEKKYRQFPKKGLAIVKEVNIDVKILPDILTNLNTIMAKKYGVITSMVKGHDQKLSQLQLYTEQLIKSLEREVDKEKKITAKNQEVPLANLLKFDNDQEKKNALYRWSNPKIFTEFLETTLRCFKNPLTLQRLSAIVKQNPVVFYYLCKFSPEIYKNTLARGESLNYFLQKLSLKHLKIYLTCFDEVEKIDQIKPEMFQYINRYFFSTLTIAESSVLLAREIKDARVKPEFARTVALLHNIGEYAILTHLSEQGETSIKRVDNLLWTWEKKLSAELLRMEFGRQLAEITSFRDAPNLLTSYGYYPLILYSARIIYAILKGKLNKEETLIALKALEGSPLNINIISNIANKIKNKVAGFTTPLHSLSSGAAKVSVTFIKPE